MRVTVGCPSRGTQKARYEGGLDSENIFEGFYVKNIMVVEPRDLPNRPPNCEIFHTDGRSTYAIMTS